MASCGDTRRIRIVLELWDIFICFSMTLGEMLRLPWSLKVSWHQDGTCAELRDASVCASPCPLQLVLHEGSHGHFLRVTLGFSRAYVALEMRAKSYVPASSLHGDRRGYIGNGQDTCTQTQAFSPRPWAHGLSPKM